MNLKLPKLKSPLGYSTGILIYPLVKRIMAKILGNQICPTMNLSLMNFEGDTDITYPLGVFNVANTYLGIANNLTEYITLWNANAANTAVGTILSGTGTTFLFRPVYVNVSVNLWALEFYTMQSSVANAVLHVSDSDIIVYGSTVVLGSAGVNTLSSALNEYNGTWGIAMTTAIQIRRVTTVTVANTNIRIFHSRLSERIGMNAVTPYSLFTGLLPKACKTFAVRGINTINFVSGITNWNELQSIEYYNIMNLGGFPYGINNVSLYYPAPPSTIGLKLIDLDPVSVNNIPAFGWITDANLPNLERLFIGSNGTPGNLVGNSVAWFLTMPKINRQLIVANGNSTLSSATESDAAWNSVATALSGIIPLAPATLRLEDTTAITAASLTSRNALIAAGWALTFT